MPYELADPAPNPRIPLACGPSSVLIVSFCFYSVVDETLVSYKLGKRTTHPSLLIGVKFSHSHCMKLLRSAGP